MALLKVVGRGGGGVEEMRGALDPSAVLWGLVRFSFGGGTFKRDKLIFVQFLGPAVGAMRRGQASARKGDVAAALGACHSDIDLTAVEDCTADFFFDKLHRAFVSDNGSFSLTELKAQYLLSLEGAARASGPRPLASDMKLRASKVLEAIRQPRGPFNWGLFLPDPTELKLFNGGSLSVEEMQRVLPEDQVLYGLLRMGFGAGPFRRTKWVFLHWVGSKTSNVKKGRGTSVKGQMMQLLKPFNADVEIGAKAEVDLKEFVTRVARFFVVDDDGSGRKDSPAPKGDAAFGFEEFLEALAEEQAQSAEYFEAAPAPAPVEQHADVTETISLVRQTHNYLNWALFSL